MSEDGKFKLIKKTSLKDLPDKLEIPESDLTIQTEEYLLQFEHVDGEESVSKYEINQGSFSLAATAKGIILEKFKLREHKLLKTIDNTSIIIKEKDKFFNNLHVYKELKRDPKRALLLCSIPGVGKSSCISEVCKLALKEDGTCVIVWDTSEIRASDVSRFFLNRSEFSKDIKRLIMVIEDIEGGTMEDHFSSRTAGSSLLNFLDGVGSPFKGVPTFIIATTNNPEQSVGALIDRPGRFDKVIEMKPPNEAECKELLKFILEKDELDDNEVSAAVLAAENEFSIAHIQESVVRSKLDQITVEDAVKELVAHKKRFKESFTKAPQQKMGFF